MNDLELSIISLLWYDDTNKHLNDITDDLFNDKETVRLLNAVKNYRKENKYDLILSYDKLGQTDTASLRAGLDRCGGLTMFDTYLNELRKKNLTRKLSQIDINSLDNTRAIEQISQALDKLKHKPVDTRIHDLKGSLIEYAEDLEKRRKGTYEWYTLGIDFLDKNFGHLFAGTFFTIGGLQGTGKSNLAFKLFSNLIQRNIPSIYFSSEMSYFSIIDRLVSINSDLSAFNIRNGNLRDEEHKQVLQVLADKISYKPGYIYETGRFDMSMVKEKIKETNAKFIFLDFLQMFRIERNQGMNTTEQVTEMANQLKEIAMDMGIIVIGLSQINSEGDLKGARAIEERSDDVLKIKTELEYDDTKTKTLSFTISKSRYGTTNKTNFSFNKVTCDFKEINNEPVKEYKQSEY